MSTFDVINTCFVAIKLDSLLLQYEFVVFVMSQKGVVMGLLEHPDSDQD